MKSGIHGKGTFQASVKRITRTGFLLEVDGQTYFMRYTLFPWFKGANPEWVRGVKRLGPDHLYWPELDIDLLVESIRSPDRFPLIAKNRDS